MLIDMSDYQFMSSLLDYDHRERQTNFDNTKQQKKTQNKETKTQNNSKTKGKKEKLAKKIRVGIGGVFFGLDLANFNKLCRNGLFEKYSPIISPVRSIRVFHFIWRTGVM